MADDNPIPNTEADLSSLRERIDKIDRDILALLNERAGCALEVAAVKQKEAGEAPPIFYRPEREAQVFEILRRLIPGH